MSGLRWRKHGTVGRDARGVPFGLTHRDGRATMFGLLLDAGFPNKKFPTQSKARQYIRNCYALWIASGGGV